MSFTRRQNQSGSGSLTTFDANAAVAAAYTNSASMVCNDQMIAALIAIKGAGSYVQSAGSNANTSVSSLSQAYAANTVANNVLVVAFAFNAGFPLVSATVTDTQGNTYTQAYMQHVLGSGFFLGVYVAVATAGGANTVNVALSGAGTPVTAWEITVHEYARTGSGSIDTSASGTNIGGGTVSLNLTTANNSELLFAAVGIRLTCGTAPTMSGPTGGIPDGWVVINEPSVGYTDQTARLYKGEGQQNGFEQEARQRGQATIHFRALEGDEYEPTRGAPVYLFDRTKENGYQAVFSGLIQDYEYRWPSNGGLRFILITAVSLEAVFDTIYADPVQYVNQTCGYIVNDLYTKFETGCPVVIGTISDGPVIPLFNAQKGAKLSEIFNELATTAGFTWYVDPVARTLNFVAPMTTPAPFNISDTNKPLFGSLDWKESGADYRNWQAVRGDYDAFPHSKEFFVGAGQLTVTLSRPVKQVTNAWATLSTCNTATGTFTGQPSAGETITIGPANGAWQATHLYALNGVIVDANGFVQKVTTNGTSGGSLPTFSQVTGGTTIDGTVIWTNQGPLGLSTGQQVYTFVASLDNTQFGQVLIGANLAATIQNLADAINATVTRAGSQLRGVTYSLPTWENAQVNAISVTGTTFVAQQKSAGTGWVAQLSEALANFSWSSSVTTGGTSPQGSLGPNEGATIELQVYQQGTSVAAPGLAYQEGSAVLTLATPLNTGSNLNVEYTREDGNIVEVSDSTEVAAFAAVTHGTGKVQQITDASSQGLISATASSVLQLAQQILSTFKVAPESVQCRLFRPGIVAGNSIRIDVTRPVDSGRYVNGAWVVQTISAEMLDAEPWLDEPNAGHFIYTLKLINLTQIGSALDFWSRGVGGGAGSAASGALVATNGGSTSNQTGDTAGGAKTINSNYNLLSTDSGLIEAKDNSPATAITITLLNPPPSRTFRVAFQNAQASNNLTLARNSLTIDGTASNLTIPPNGGVQLYTDGVNWFTERGIGGLTNPMTTKGDIIVAATGGTPARLGVGADGKVLTADSAATNGESWQAPLILTTTGSSGAATLTAPGAGSGNPYTLNVPQYSGGGSGPNKVVVYTRPSLGSMTWFNQGSATGATNADDSVTIVVPANATDSLRGLTLSVPGSTPYSIYAAFNLTAQNGNGGLCISDGTKYITFNRNSTGVNNFLVQRWTNSTTFSATSYNVAHLMYAQAVFMRIDNDGTNLIYYISPDAFTWQQVFSEAKGAFLGTITRYGFCGDSATTSYAAIVQCLSLSTSAFTAS